MATKKVTKNEAKKVEHKTETKAAKKETKQPVSEYDLMSDHEKIQYVMKHKVVR